MSDELTAKYRGVLFSQLGMEVLADIMVNHCHFGQYLDPNDAEAIGAYNVGMKIMSRLGIFNPGVDIWQIMNALSSVQPKKEE